MRTAYKILAWNPKGKNHFEDQKVDWKKEHEGMVTRFVLLRTGPGCQFLSKLTDLWVA
jgi:hypothetical protein